MVTYYEVTSRRHGWVFPAALSADGVWTNSLDGSQMDATMLQLCSAKEVTKMDHDALCIEKRHFMKLDK